MNTFGIDRSTGNGITVSLENELPMKTVNEVCKMVGITRKTLFYYDKVGLLKPTTRIGPQKQKLYSEHALRKLVVIRIYRSAGFTIHEIKKLLDGQEKKQLFKELINRNRTQEIRIHKQIAIADEIQKLDLDTESLQELVAILKESENDGRE